MGTQIAVLNVVISVKIQEKTQEKIQKKKKKCTKTTKSANIQQHILREQNTCQDQPQVEHETFQLNARPQNSKESISRKNYKLCLFL